MMHIKYTRWNSGSDSFTKRDIANNSFELVTDNVSPYASEKPITVYWHCDENEGKG